MLDPCLMRNSYWDLMEYRQVVDGIGNIQMERCWGPWSGVVHFVNCLGLV